MISAKKGVSMKSLNRAAIGALLCLVAAMAIHAQMGMGGPPQMHGVWNPVVGNGAAYDIQSKNGDTTSMEITIVGKETVSGSDGFWMEMSMNGTKMHGTMVMKFLTVLNGSDTHTTRMIMQMAGSPPMEMPTQMVQARHKDQPTDIRGMSEDIGSESITVPAGTFTCEHYRSKDASGGDTWVTAKVSPWGMVKHQSADSTVVLTKVITDAKDKITGTPIPFDPMKMGQHGGPPQQ
jgi:hypothetical protein